MCPVKEWIIINAKIWAVSVEYDSCDSGCEDPVYDTMFTDLKKANEFFEKNLDEMANEFGSTINEVCLDEYEENVDGILVYKKTLKQFYSYGVDSHLATVNISNKEVEKYLRILDATRVSNIYEKYSQNGRYTMNINGSIIGGHMMSWRFRDLIDKHIIGSNSPKRLFIAFVPMCRG